jgi:hypothetical protein
MALETLDSSSQDQTPDDTSSTVVGKAVAAKGPYALPTPTGAVGVDPSLLENMQKLISERDAQKNSFMENLKDAQAWWSGGMAGPGEALRARAKEREEQEATTFGMRSQLAQYKVAQEQAKNLDKALFGNTSMNPAVVGGTQPGAVAQGSQQVNNAVPGAPQANGGLLNLVRDPGLQQSIATQAASGDRTGAMKAIQSYLAKNAEDPQMVKELNYMVSRGLIDPKLVPAAVLTKFVGSGALVPHDVRGVAGTGQGTPFGAAAAVSPGGAPANMPAISSGAPAAAPAAPAAAPAAPAVNTAPAGTPFVKPPTNFPPPPVQAPAKQPLAGATPGQLPRVASPFAPGTKDDLEFQAKNAEVPLEGAKEFAKETEKANAAKAVQIDTASLTAGERKARFENVKSIIDDPDMQMAFGKMAKKGFTPFVVKQLESGINAGQFGTLGIGDLQRNLLETDLSPTQIDKLHQVENALKTAELEYAKTYLTGQGSVSDNERKLIQAAVGSMVKDPAKVLKTQVSVMAERADFDKKIGKLYDGYRDSHGDYASFSKFMRTEEARQLIDNHNSSLAKIIGRNKAELNDPFSGKGAQAAATEHPGKSLVDQYLKGK